MDDHVLNRSHRDFEEIGVGCVCEMAIDFSVGAAVQGGKLVHEVLARLLPAGCVALEVGKAEFGDGALRDLCLEQINLVEEQNERGVLEPMRIRN